MLRSGRMAKRKNPAAVALGRKGGKATAKNLTPEQRSEMAKLAAEARWAKAKGDADRAAVVRATKAKKPKA